MTEQHDFQTIMDLQAILQKGYNKGVPLEEMPEEEKPIFIKDMVISLEDELHELLREVGWKPWASSRHVNRDAAVGELVDAFHFFMNLCLVLGVDEQELFTGYLQKNKINQSRQASGYDGVSTKCPKCKLALDDPATKCNPFYDYCMDNKES